jgi:hypothetical protein
MKHFIRRELPCRRNGDKGKLISVYLARAMIKVTNQFRLCVCVCACVRVFAYLNSIVAFSTTHIICRKKNHFTDGYRNVAVVSGTVR